jgi:uncharacterized protein YkwD
MSEIRLRSTLLGLGLLALAASGCGQALDENLPQNEAQPNAPEGILFLGPDDALPPGFTIQSLTATEQSQMLAAVNATRTKSKVCGTTTYTAAAALVSNSLLISAAEKHALDMATYNYFSHTGRDGSTVGTRVTRTGYKWSTVGENIAAGYTTIADTVAGWYKSEGHCKNFMNKAFTQVGFGKAYTSTSTYKYYWVAVLAKPL